MRFIAASALLLLLALGTADAACSVEAAKCNTNLKKCRTTLSTRIATTDACLTKKAACDIARSKCVKDLAVAKEQKDDVSARANVAAKARAACNASLKKTLAEKNTCNTKLIAASTELSQAKTLLNVTLTKWGVPVTGRDLADVSNGIEFMLSNLKSSPEFKEGQSVLDTLLVGLNKCGLSNIQLPDTSTILNLDLNGLLGGAVDCVGALLAGLGL